MYQQDFILKMKKGLSCFKLNPLFILCSTVLLLGFSLNMSYGQVIISVVDVNGFSESEDSEMEDWHLSIYPNPVVNYTTLNKEKDTKIEYLEIINYEGEIMYSNNVTSNEIFIPNIPIGINYLKIRTNKGLKVLNLVLTED